jgi:hypothetical protein
LIFPGKFLRLKDTKWGTAIETAIGARTLKGWLVNKYSPSDFDLLRECFTEAGL